MDGRGVYDLGKYTIQPEWPDDLCAAAGDVIRAKLEKRRFKHKIVTCARAEIEACQDCYIRAEYRLASAKARFNALIQAYQSTMKSHV